MNGPPPHYVYYHRRFGFFRRFWWFALGAGAATLWARSHHERGARTEERSRRCDWREARQLRHAERLEERKQWLEERQNQPPPYRYDWAAHRPGLRPGLEGAMPPAPVTANTTVHDTPPVAQDQDTKAAPTTPSAAENSTTSTTFSTSTGPSEAEMREIEARARAYAADKLERLSDLLDRLRVNLVEANANGSTPPPPPPPTPDEPRMV